MSAFELENVDFEYRDSEQTFKALSGISLGIKKGEFVSIVGASGSGKSTLMNLLGLLAVPTSGSLKILGASASHLQEPERASLRNRNIGFIFQQFALLPRLNVQENIYLPSTFDIETISEGILQQRAQLLLNKFGMADKALSLPANLSGGQKQRVAICRALFMNPDVILADEPTGALDSQTSAEVLKILRELNSEGKTVIIITHDRTVAAYTDRMVEVSDGNIVSDGLTENGKLKKSNAENILLNAAQNKPIVLPHKSDFFLDKSGFVDKFVASMRLWILSQYSLFQRSYRNLINYKLRSFLTMLGLLMGIASIIIIAGLSELVNSSFTKAFYTNSTKKLYISYDRYASIEKNKVQWEGFDSRLEFPALAEAFSKWGKIRPRIAVANCDIVSASLKTRTELRGMTDYDNYLELDSPIKLGRLPNPLDFVAERSLVVLGHDVVDNLFAKDYVGRKNPDFPLGEVIVTQNCPLSQSLTVSGVFKKRDTSDFTQDTNNWLFAPAPSMLKHMGPTKITRFSILPADGVDAKWLGENVTNFLKIKLPGVEFQTQSPSSGLDKVFGFIKVIQGVMGFVGFLCIFVGGIGIMNIMLVTVTERTREVGILKSIGAQPHHIRKIFLAESVTLCLIACVIAVGIGFVFNNLLSLVAALLLPEIGGFKLVTVFGAVIIGVVVSFLSGIGFGFLPALRAGRMEPAACLREE